MFRDEYGRPLEPPEPRVDGKLICEECEEIIPGDYWYFDFNGHILCESCAEDHKHLAPFREE